jgi:aryl-alcohol dehydrogenase-like predicted oxidoreductase
MNMERSKIPGTSIRLSPVAIGTWAIGGWMWGGTDEAESIATIRAAFEHGINVVDTAPAYGFGRSEEIVGKAIAESRLRSNVVIATKVGLQWDGGKVSRNASRARIMGEVEDSLRRLRTDYIDVYQVHWPDPLITIEETADAMHQLFAQGKIRAIGVSNFSVGQMERFRRVAPLMYCNRRTICSNAASRPIFCPTAEKTRSRCLVMGRCAEACCRDACGRIRYLVVTI